jgi:hypothetical protein
MPFVFEGQIEVQTPKAIRFQGNYWDAAIWLPLSQVTITPDEDSHVIKVRDWLAEKKGLLEFTHFSEQALEEMDG